jgi:hypothetical protein
LSNIVQKRVQDGKKNEEGWQFVISIYKNLSNCCRYQWRRQELVFLNQYSCQNSKVGRFWKPTVRKYGVLQRIGVVGAWRISIWIVSTDVQCRKFDFDENSSGAQNRQSESRIVGGI